MEEDQRIDVHRLWEIIRLMQSCDLIYVSLSPLRKGRPHTCAYNQIQNFLRVDTLAFVILQTDDSM